MTRLVAPAAPVIGPIAGAVIRPGIRRVTRVARLRIIGWRLVPVPVRIAVAAVAAVIIRRRAERAAERECAKPDADRRPGADPATACLGRGWRCTKGNRR